MRRSLAVAASAWFSGGLGFSCTKCGKCCKQPNLHVWVSPLEVEEMAKHLNMDVQDFSEEYLTEGSFGLGNEASKLLLKRGPDSQSCIFLDKDNKCRVYKARPVHPNHLVSKLDWNAEAAKCEGMVPVDAMGTENEIGSSSVDLVTEDKIIENIFIEEVNNQSGSSWNYTRLKDIVYGLEDHVLQDFQEEYVQQNWRRVVYESDTHVVVDSHFHGEATGRRALLLKDAPTFVQTEIPFDPEDDADLQAVVELVQPPHQGMFLGFLQWVHHKSVTPDEASSTGTKCQIAVLGAGCGALPSALLDIDSGVHAQVDAVEVDTDVLSIGKKYFGFCEREDLKIHHKNAAQFIGNLPGCFLDAVFLDAASLSESKQLTAPPDELCSHHFFSELCRCMAPDGFLVINIVGGKTKFHQVYTQLQSVFKHVWCLRLPSQLLLYAKNDENWAEKMNNMKDNLSIRVRGLVTSTLEQISLHDSTSRSYMGWLDEISIKELMVSDHSNF